MTTTRYHHDTEHGYASTLPQPATTTHSRRMSARISSTTSSASSSSSAASSPVTIATFSRSSSRRHRRNSKRSSSSYYIHSPAGRFLSLYFARRYTSCCIGRIVRIVRPFLRPSVVQPQVVLCTVWQRKGDFPFRSFVSCVPRVPSCKH